jgi:hypothetical protein
VLHILRFVFGTLRFVFGGKWRELPEGWGGSRSCDEMCLSFVLRTLHEPRLASAKSSMKGDGREPIDEMGAVLGVGGALLLPAGPVSP